MIRQLAYLILILFAQAAFAWPPTYGAEFELTNLEIVRTRYGITKNDPSKSPERKYQLILAEHLKHKCAVADCFIEEISGKFGTDFKLEFKDGFWIKYSIDPSCIEISFKPQTLTGLNENSERVNEYVFKAGEEIGLTSKRNNTTHFNVGINSLFKNAEEFLRFFVDYANRPDLALGSLGKDINNAPPLAVLKDAQRTALKNIVHDFNSGLITSIQIAAERIQNEVYTDSYKAEWGGPHHYQAIGLKYVNRTWLTDQDAPMELRSVWAQHSMEDFILIARLIEGRVAYLNKYKSKIIYNETKKTKFSIEQLKTRFKIYIEEAGLNFDDYEKLMPEPEELQKARLTPLLEKSATNEKKLLDLIHYFDLLSSSETVQNIFVEVLSDPNLQENPRCKAYLQYFEKMAAKPWYTQILISLGLSQAEAIEHNNDRNTQDLYQKIRSKIDSKKAKNKPSWINKTNHKTKQTPKILMCEQLF